MGREIMTALEAFRERLAQAEKASMMPWNSHIGSDYILITVNDAEERMKIVSGLILAGFRNFTLNPTSIFVQKEGKSEEIGLFIQF